MKSYNDIVIGYKAYKCCTEEYVGTVAGILVADDLSENELVDWDMSVDEIRENFDLVLINEDMGCFDDSLRVYNYDNDPSRVFCK